MDGQAEMGGQPNRLRKRGRKSRSKSEEEQEQEQERGRQDNKQGGTT